MMEKAGRNDPCPCGSGKKYKQCCLGKPPKLKFAAKVIKSGVQDNGMAPMVEKIYQPSEIKSENFKMTDKDFRVTK